VKVLRAAAVSLLAACVAGSVQAEPTPTERAAARVHAQDIADLFREACLQQQADPEAAAGWAVAHGFINGTGTRSGREVTEAMKQRGERGNVFARRPDDDSMLLVVTASPPNCVVMGMSMVDGPRLRGRTELLAGEWPGATFTPEPIHSMDYDEKVPHRILRYTGVAEGNSYRLTVVSPLGVARGSAVLGVSAKPRH